MWNPRSIGSRRARALVQGLAPAVLALLLFACEKETAPTGAEVTGGNGDDGVIAPEDAPEFEETTHDSTESDGKGCAASSTPSCAMDGHAVDCSIAVWDCHIAGQYGAVGGATPRAMCAEACASGQLSSLDGVWLLYDKGACGHSVEIKGMSCAACCTLEDSVPDQLRCDNDPCTYDWCEGADCHHDPFGWVGEPCVVPGTSATAGEYLCDDSMCQAGAAPCRVEHLKKCVAK